MAECTCLADRIPSWDTLSASLMAVERACRLLHDSRAVIFDLDGVLVDSELTALSILARLLGEAGSSASATELRPICGHSKEDLKCHVVDTYGLSESTASALLRRFDAVLDDETSRRPPAAFPGAIDLAEILTAIGKRLAVGSASLQTRVSAELKAIGISPMLEVIVTGSDVQKGKPAPDIFLMCATRLGMAPVECVVIEDAPTGIEAAARAGMACIALAHTFEPAALGSADVVVDNMASLASAFRAEVPASTVLRSER